MLIGIISDTHGDEHRTRIAAEALRDAKVKHVFHCGDIGSEGVLVELAAVFSVPGIPVQAVFGNCDYNIQQLKAFPAAETGVEACGYKVETELGGEKLAVYHGHEPELLHGLANSGDFDYVFFGHTHVKEDRVENDTRMINPGAVYRAREPSVATLQLTSGKLTYIPLKF